MSRKDYIECAAMFNRLRSTVPLSDTIAHEAIHNCCKDMASMFRRDNSRFDYQRFMTACGY